MKRVEDTSFIFNRCFYFREIRESSMFVEKSLQLSKIFMPILQIYTEPAKENNFCSFYVSILYISWKAFLFVVI